ncbi:MAG: HD domain-containing protein [Acidobacteria bacterium]|nr:HD domain-containing protein [Acidobacteriota bacterium]
MTKSHLSGWGRLYVGSIVVFGLAAIAHSAYGLYAHPIGWNWLVLAVLTLLSGSATVKLPSVPATISISETFVFTSVLLFGPAAGTLTVALDALVMSLWLARRGHPAYRLTFNVCALPTALWLSAHLFYGLAPDGLRPLSLETEAVNIGDLISPLLAFTVTYFLLNSWLIAFAIKLERGLSAFRVWRENFAWLSLNYVGGACIAALLVTYTRDIDFAYLVFVLPLLAVLYFTFAMALGRVEDANRHLTELNRLYMSTIETLAMAIDAKDQVTHGHIRRVQQLSVALARALGIRDEEQIRAIEAASLLHDMGKLAVPEYILNKPGPLTVAEFDKMKLHASVGADILSAIDFPYPVVPIVRHHHENWDGTGYPDGLEGSQIPIGARVLSVVDCFDALTSDRPYRPRLPDAEALKILTDRRGRMYDPLVVDTFFAVRAQITSAPEAISTSAAGLSAITRGAITSETWVAGTPLDNISASTEEMLVLYELSRGLAGRLDLADAGDLIAKHLRRMIPMSTCVFYVYDQGSDEIIAAHATGENSSHFKGIRIPRGQRLSGWVAANRQTISNSDPILDLGESVRAMTPRPLSCLSTPLLLGNDLIGVLSIYSTNRQAFTDDHCRIIEATSRQVSQTVRYAVEFEEQRTRSLRDHSTGLPNAEHLRRFVASEVSAGTPHASFTLLYIQWTSSHSLNKQPSQATDEELAAVLSSAQRALRAADILFRHGDQELIALLTQTDQEGASQVLKRVRSEFQHLCRSRKTEHLSPLEVSIGAASAPEDGADAETLISRARRSSASASDEPVFRPPSIH